MMHLGHKQADTHSLAGNMITMSARIPGNDTVKTQSSQVVGHPTRRVLLRGMAHKLGDERSQVGIAESRRQQHEQAQRLEQRHRTLITKTQGRCPLPIDDLRPVDLFKGLVTQLAVLTDLFDFEESSVGFKADLPQQRVDSSAGDQCKSHGCC